jgi:TolB-like protein/DNA-binding winged helix-turn-helix (wHTH) protein
MGVRASMDTAGPSKLGAIRFGVFEVDLRAGELCKQGVKVKLQEQPFQVLQVLLERPGEVVTREELRQRIWSSDTFVDFEGGVYNAVKRLRDALGDTADTPRFVETIPRRGYRFIGTVNGDLRVDSQTAEMPRRQATPRRDWTQYGAGALGVLVVVGILYWLNVRSMREPEQGIPKIQSIAVLPFPSLSDDVKQGYFAQGFTDALITALARIHALRVTSRTSVLQYADSKKPLPQVARELKVEGIVEGTVQRFGDRVRITAQLVDGPTDQHLWADSFEADVRDELVLENTIASTIADQIRINVTPEERAQLKSVRPVNLKALDAYLEARFHLDQARKQELYYRKEPAVAAELSKAVAYLDLAIREDPNYVPAHLAYFNAVNEMAIQRLSFLPRARSALQRALELDETNVRAHLALARLLMQYQYDWGGAEREFKRAIQLNPGSAEAHAAYAEYLDNVGRSDEASKERELAQSLDPTQDYYSQCCEGTVVVRAGMSLEQKKQIVDETASDDPYMTAEVAKEYAVAGRYKESVELYERCLTLYGWHDFVKVLKRANAKGGPKFALQEWMRAGEQYSREHGDGDLPVFAMAFTYASLGNKDRAFAWLDKAYEQRNWCIIYLKDDTVWDPLRSDPRFTDLLRRVGLPP